MLLSFNRITEARERKTCTTLLKSNHRSGYMQRDQQPCLLATHKGRASTRSQRQKYTVHIEQAAPALTPCPLHCNHAYCSTPTHWNFVVRRGLVRRRPGETGGHRSINLPQPEAAMASGCTRHVTEYALRLQPSGQEDAAFVQSRENLRATRALKLGRRSGKLASACASDELRWRRDLVSIAQCCLVVVTGRRRTSAATSISS